MEMEMYRCMNCMEKLEKEGEVCPYCGYDGSKEEPSPSALRQETILRGKYLIGRVLGRGGFGMTYVGFDLTLNLRVAVKEYFPLGVASRDISQSDSLQWGYTEAERENWQEGLEQFLSEARKMAKLDEVPGIVRVRDVFQANQTAYIVMDFAEGVTLRQYLKKNGVMDWKTCLEMFLPVMDSVEVMHNKGMIHRDISPDNLMVQERDGKCSLKLLDFGAAFDTRREHTGGIPGVVKPYFSAPEQYVRNGNVGRWSDEYSIAAVIYYCLTGRTLPEAMERVTAGSKVAMDGIDNKKLRTILSRAFAVKEEERYETVGEFRKALASLLPSASPIPKKWIAALAAVVIVAGGLFMVQQNTTAFSAERETEDGLLYKVKGNGTVVLTGYQGGEDYVVIPDVFEDGEYSGDISGSFPGDVLICRYATPEELSYDITSDRRSAIVLNGYMGSETVVALPAQINGVPVREIGEKFMYKNEKVQRVILPEGIETIGKYAFEYASALEQANLPEGLQSVGSFAFHDTQVHDLTIPSTLEKASSGTFTGVSEIRVADENEYYTLEDGILFYRDDTKNWLVWVDPSKEGDYVVPDDVTLVVSGAFYRTGLTSVTWSDKLEAVNPNMFDQSDSLRTFVFGEGVQTIGNKAFQDCGALESIEIPLSVTEIGKEAFSGCTSLKTAFMGTDCEVAENSFDEDAAVFRYETISDESSGETGVVLTGYAGKAEVVEVPAEIAGMPVREIGEKFMFNNKEIRRVILPEGIETIGKYAFEYASALEQVNLPEGLQSVGSFAFKSTQVHDLTIPSTLKNTNGGTFAGVSEIRVADENEYFTLEDGILFYRDDTENWLVWVDPSKEGDYVVPDDVTFVPSGAFYRTGLTSVTWSDKLEAVNPSMFDQSGSLRTFVFGKGVQKIGDNAFQDCGALESIEIPLSVTKIGEKAFSGCTSLKTAFVGTDCEVAENAFDDGTEIRYYN